MFDCDAEQPDEHFCQGPLPPNELPCVMYAGPSQASQLEPHSARIASFAGELLGPRTSAASQVTVGGSCKDSIKSELLQDPIKGMAPVMVPSAPDVHDKMVCSPEPIFWHS